MQETNCAAGLYDFWLPWAWGHGQFQICLIIRRGRPAIEFSSCAGLNRAIQTDVLDGERRNR